jgi:hypothetical protein
MKLSECTIYHSTDGYHNERSSNYGVRIKIKIQTHYRVFGDKCSYAYVPMDKTQTPVNAIHSYLVSEGGYAGEVLRFRTVDENAWLVSIDNKTETLSVSLRKVDPASRGIPEVNDGMGRYSINKKGDAQ